MKLIFFGTGSFALPSLAVLREHVSLVVTQPDRPTGRGMKLQPSPAKLLAQEFDIPCETPEKARAIEFVERIEAEKADALVVASYGQILSQRLLDSALRGGINLHGSILPRYRGAAPIQRSVLNGDPETGVTLMQMDRGMDTGDMIHIERLTIDPDETYGELQDRLAILAAAMAREWLPKIIDGDYPRIVQDSDQATTAPKIDRSEATLSFARPAGEEYNRFRAFTPSPGVSLPTSLGSLKLARCRLSEMPTGTEDSPIAEPGAILATSPNLTVAFATGAIEFIELKPEGKKSMSGRDFANGARLRPGMRLD